MSAPNKHTPGPWRYVLDGEPDNDMRHAVLAEINDLWVAACYRSGTRPRNDRSSAAEREAEANARLIAASPELLAACERLLSVVEQLMPGAKHIAVPNYAELNDAPIAARQAIAKARGEA